MRWCLKKAEQEGRRHRGLRRGEPDSLLARRHLDKAEHNLRVMLLLMRNDAQDWAVSASFYAAYHALLAILASHGYESRNQECTFAAVEYLIKQGKIPIDNHWLRRIAAQGDDSSLVSLREEFQYGTDTDFEAEHVQEMADDTKEFIERVKEILSL